MLRFPIQCALFPYAAEMKVKKKKRGIKGTSIYLSLYDVYEFVSANAFQGLHLIYFPRRLPKSACVVHTPKEQF